MKYYCIGEKLSHSLSCEIHRVFGDYPYELLEIKRENLPDFFEKREFSGLNVTVPYKETVMEYMDCLSETARKIDAVNTVVNRDGKLYGYNTDLWGFSELCRVSGIDISGKRIMILGSGGTAKTVRCAAKEMGAAEIFTVSRSGKEGTYPYDAAPSICPEIIVNTTPVGMFPNTDKCPVNMGDFPSCKAVIDAVYNPTPTKLMISAEERGMKAVGGLYMLVSQGAKSSELFTGVPVEDEKLLRAYTAAERMLV